MELETSINVFDRVVCGLDHSEAGFAAARAAARIASPGAPLVLVAVNDPSIAVHAGWQMPKILEELAAEARAALERGRIETASHHLVEAKLVKGDARQALLGEIARREATLVVVGTHGLARVTGIALGAVSTHLLHEAPCSVLLVRGAIDADHWPRRITVGIDGSACAAHALGAARGLADRFDAPLRVIAAAQDAHVDLVSARRLAPELEEHDERALIALRVASGTSDLMVVGSRGLRGLRALGSLSERLAHEAHCSVLVVRTPQDET